MRHIFPQWTIPNRREWGDGGGYRVGVVFNRRSWAVALIIIGCALMLWPFISVWRLSEDVLNELPEIPNAEVVFEDQNPLALFDTEFELATRRYRGLTWTELREVLAGAGFEPYSQADEIGMTKPCCGAYDGVVALLRTTTEGDIETRLTVQDADIQITWPFFAALGAAVAASGGLAMLKARQHKSETDTEAEFAT